MRRKTCECPNCKYKGTFEKNPTTIAGIIVLLIGIILFPFGLILPVIWHFISAPARCPRCKFKHIIIK